MSNYCACSGGDEEYTIELNQQGPEGPQGPIGQEGFSPSISIKTNTDKSYVLTVVNKEGSFDTPNLYGELEKLNADLSNIPNPAFINGIALSRSGEGIPSIEIDGSKITTDIDGNLMLSASSEDKEGTESFNYEVVVNPTEQHLELHDNEGNVKIVATTDYIPTIDVATTTTAGIVKPDGSTITVSADGTISANLSNYVTSDELSVDIQDINSKIASKLDTATYEADKATYATKEELASTDATVTNLQTSVASNTTAIGTLREDLSNLETTVGNNSADIAALDADKLEQSNIIAGANVTIDRSGNNLTISSTGGGGGGSSIDDGSITSASTWSSSKINSEITTAVDTINSTKNDNIFDIGKFTIVGSPTITEEGVASGFSGSNYLTTLDNINLGNNSWQFNCTINTSADVQTEQWFLNSINSTVRNITVINELNNNIPVIRVRCYVYNTNTSRYDAIQGTFNSSPNTQYKISIKYDGNSIYTFMCNNESYTVTNSYKASGANKIIIGKRYPSDTSFIANGSIDLKQFSITVDGVNVFNGLMESTKPIYDKLNSTSSELSTFKTDTDNNFSAVESALNEKANLSDLSGYVTITKYNELLARVVALETEINGGNA